MADLLEVYHTHVRDKILDGYTRADAVASAVEEFNLTAEEAKELREFTDASRVV